MADIWKQLQDAIKNSRDGKSNFSMIQPYESPPDARNEAVFFFKPELTSDSNIDLPTVIEAIHNSFAKYAVEIVAAEVLSGEYLEKHNIMARHYGTINKISREGEKGLTPDGRAKLQEVFGKSIAEGATVLGGHQFLEEIRSFEPKSLSDLWDQKNATSVKLSPGVYAIEYSLLGRRIVVLNGFHPHQLAFYTAPGRSIAVLIVRSPTGWKTLRNDLVGATDPNQAVAGSVRRYLLENRRALRIEAVNKGLNGVHLSAGPIEAYFEIDRFFGSVASVPNHANLLLAFKRAGLAQSALKSLADNPAGIIGGDAKPVFDATEELDMGAAVGLIAQIRN